MINILPNNIAVIYYTMIKSVQPTKASKQLHNISVNLETQKVMKERKDRNQRKSTFWILNQSHIEQNAKKIIKNYEIYQSILPVKDEHIRTCSKKIIYKQQMNGYSGISLLMEKASLNYSKSEKKHLRALPKFESSHSCKRFFRRQSEQKKQIRFALKDKRNLPTKINNDLMSSLANTAYKRPDEINQNMCRKTKSSNRMNLESGLQVQRKRRTSQRKISELVGNGLDGQPQFQKVKRVDYRNSSIIFG